MSAISQLLLTWFWPNFKRRFLGPSLTHSDCHGGICPYREYLICYWPDFDQTLKVGSSDHLEQLKLSQLHLSSQHLSSRHLSISGISQLLLSRFWPNIKGRFLGPFWTDSNCHGDLWPGNICPGHICPAQEYLTCYWPNFEQTFWTQFLQTLIYFGPKMILDPKFFWTKI